MGGSVCVSFSLPLNPLTFLISSRKASRYRQIEFLGSASPDEFERSQLDECGSPYTLTLSVRHTLRLSLSLFSLSLSLSFSFYLSLETRVDFIQNV